MTFKESSAVYGLNYFTRLYCNLPNVIVHPTVVFKAPIITVNCLLQLFILLSCIPSIEYMLIISCFLITDKNALTSIKTIHMLVTLRYCQHTSATPNANKTG